MYPLIMIHHHVLGFPVSISSLARLLRHRSTPGAAEWAASGLRVREPGKHRGGFPAWIPHSWMVYPLVI